MKMERTFKFLLRNLSVLFAWHAHTHTHTHTHTHSHTHTHTHTHTVTHARTHSFTHARTHARTHTGKRKHINDGKGRTDGKDVKKVLDEQLNIKRTEKEFAWK